MSADHVIIGLFGARLDAASGPERWSSWRPSVAMCQHEELLVRRFELLYESKQKALAEVAVEDIRSVSPETEVRLHELRYNDPWDFEQVYAELHDFALRAAF